VATPIGNLEDLSPRARRVLAGVSVIAAEDTRRTRQLLSSFQCTTPLIALHEHNETEQVPGLVKRLQAGDGVALVSDAGTPLIADPGFQLVRACHGHGLSVLPVPGPSAVLAALSVAGLPTDRFVFEGFLPRKGRSRRDRLDALAAESRTMVLFESVHRVTATLAEVAAKLGADRPAGLARELSKLHESVIHGTLGDIAQALQCGQIPLRGEFVLVIAGAAEAPLDLAQARRVYAVLSAELAPDQALKLTSQITGIRRNELYAALRAEQAMPSDALLK